MLQYSANIATLCYYMCLLSCEGCRNVQHCQECKGELQCNRPRASPALVSDATRQYDEIFILSPTRSCTISFGAASCSLMTSSYQCFCLVSPLPFCIGVVCSPARPILDLSLDTYLYHRSQLPCTCHVVV